MTSFLLKLIALTCMIIDHIGAIIPDMPSYMRWIGRISFPIFAFLIAEGCTHTKNINKYLLRLGVFAIISEIPFDLAVNQTRSVMRDLPLQIDFLGSTNIFYTLFLGVACVIVYESFKNKEKVWLAYIPLVLTASPLIFSPYYYGKTLAIILISISAVCIFVLSFILANKRQGQAQRQEYWYMNRGASAAIPLVIPFVLLAELINTDYSMNGVFLIFALYAVRKKWLRVLVLLAGVIVLYMPSSLSLYSVATLAFALLAVGLTALYNGKQGFKMKWSFYWFYPVHLSALAYIYLLYIRMP